MHDTTVGHPHPPALRQSQHPRWQTLEGWLAAHPRFRMHFTPVHCSWMNQVEQWFGILQRKRLGITDFADKAILAERLHAFIAEWDQVAHPFRWTSRSFDKVLAKCQLPALPIAPAQIAA